MSSKASRLLKVAVTLYLGLYRLYYTLVKNKMQGYTYNLIIYKNKEMIWQDKCGKFHSYGCNNNEYKQGIVYSKEYTLFY